MSITPFNNANQPGPGYDELTNPGLESTEAKYRTEGVCACGRAHSQHTWINIIKGNSYFCNNELDNCICDWYEEVDEVIIPMKWPNDLNE